VSSHVLSSIGYEATTVDENKINLKRMIIWSQYEHILGRGYLKRVDLPMPLICLMTVYKWKN
jgi:hypothetical protein